MDGDWFDNEGRERESSRLATRYVLTRPWVLALIALVLAAVLCSA